MPRPPRGYQEYRGTLADRIADSIAAPFAPATSRILHGAAQLPGKATAVVGMRRAGKTTYLHQVRSERAAAGVPRERLPYLNLEDERLVGLEARHLGLAIEEHYRRFPALRGRERVVWCFDEVQLVPGWERLVRRLLDTERVEVLVSGSSAALLSREIATALRGRAWEVVIHPFGFEEFLRHHGRPVPADPAFLPAPERSALEHDFLDYLTGGGFPETQGLDVATRRRLLTDYVDVALLRDVVERHRVSNVVGLRWLARQLLGNAGGLFSVEKFHAALRSQGLAIAKSTLHHLLGALEDCFLVRTVWLDARSERRRMVNPRKAYPVDPGLIPLFDRLGQANLGHALETAVLIELERRHADVTYVRTVDGFEVDFMARWPQGGETLIQVCADASGDAVTHRELRALEAAGREYPRAARWLLTATRDGVPDAPPSGVEVRPAYEWFLSRSA